MRAGAAKRIARIAFRQKSRKEPTGTGSSDGTGHGCESGFNVLSGTIFGKTRVPLHKRFPGIAIIAKKSTSSPQPTRDPREINYKMITKSYPLPPTHNPEDPGTRKIALPSGYLLSP